MRHSTERILVVEDEDISRKNLVHVLTKEGYDVVAAESGLKALDLLAGQNFDLVITDFKMEKVDGMQVLARSRELQPFTEVIMITGYATVDLAVKAMKNGAYFYLAKPFKIAEVRGIVKEALLKRRLQVENVELKNELKKHGQGPFLIAGSKTMLSVMDTVKQIAPSDSNVLILGESGTGKELVAKAVHALSLRSAKKFVAFNCGAFTEELMANELFGHEKGAFTGADREKSGLIEIADGGTIFLDEIGDMPLTMQVKLLRAIQEKEILRVGGIRPVAVDIRFIAATHRDLQKDIEQGLFRKDLYYRLNVISLNLPPLVEREGDIPLLAQHFLKEKSRLAGKNFHGIDTKAMSLLCRYHWPGNVRELENVIERAVALGNGQRIGETDLPEHIATLSLAETYRQPNVAIPSLEEQEKRYILWVLEKCNGNKTRAAQIMGIDRVSLWRKIKRYKLLGESEH